ncbi:hypothetical protein J5N97_000413 [Dioscorea zingiberensis]|uniref:Uncharacterized protein n=1 Tax=Dioscorea zingiberensis TaxID=325984 RepID=A0A9D5BVB8_9LILI|nr:hypothetical protein J5N97_000413 [Dioscorea zingiberensis]
MAAYYFGEMSYVKPPAEEVLKGLFIPKLKGNGATVDVIALMDALVMLMLANTSSWRVDLRCSSHCSST